MPATSLVFAPPGVPREFRSSPGAARGFCAGCGSFLYWREVGGGGAGLVGFSVGMVDPACLRAFGRALCNGGGERCWCGNEVEGVTDSVVRGMGGRR